MRKPAKRMLCKDEPGGMALVVAAEGDAVAIRQYDWGLREGISDCVIVPDTKAARELAKWLERWARWKDSR